MPPQKGTKEHQSRPTAHVQWNSILAWTKRKLALADCVQLSRSSSRKGTRQLQLKIVSFFITYYTVQCKECET